MDRRIAALIAITNAGLRIVAALVFFLIPVFLVGRDLRDPAIRSPGVPKAAWRLHRELSPKYERWARRRLNSTRPSDLSLQDISGTEWPLFGSVFYLWATELLQESWEQEGRSSSEAPMEYARGAVEAAKDLVIDPVQAAWVRTHWGEDYLSRENLFYRMLVIAALTSHARLTGSDQHLRLLRDQVEGLAGELAGDVDGRGLPRVSR